MIPSTFTGTSRPRRQVNLSGRTNNPFAAFGNRSSSLPAQNAVVNAQQERIQRQRERERPPAAINIQKTWRGYRQRLIIRGHWRDEWDLVEARSPGQGPYESETTCLHQIRLLVHFASPSREPDVARLCRLAQRLLTNDYLEHIIPTSHFSQNWVGLLTSLARLTIRTFPECGAKLAFDPLLELIRGLARVVPDRISGPDYYRALVVALRSYGNATKVEAAACALLQSNSPATSTKRIIPGPHHFLLSAHSGLAWVFLVEPLSSSIKLDSLAGSLDFQLLTQAIQKDLSGLSTAASCDQALWLLAHYIYFFRRSPRGQPETSTVEVISNLISYCAPEIEPEAKWSEDFTTPSRRQTPPFIEQQLDSLVNQESVIRLLSSLEDTSTPQDSEAVDHASSSATYVLTLLRVFPKRADDIRMWLFMGGAQSGKGKLPALRFFFNSISRSAVFTSISREPRNSIKLLKADSFSQLAVHGSSQSLMNATAREWRVIILFMELYKFVLLIMDDEEFLSESLPLGDNQSSTRQSALPLHQVAELITFLKHLAFSMYWNGSEIIGIQKEESQDGLSQYFGVKNPNKPIQQASPSVKRDDQPIAGIPGMTLSHLKGMVTGLLRMLYERDSRRRFLPTGHWLMTKYFEMDRFIAAVVAEEEAKKTVGDVDQSQANISASTEAPYEDEDDDGDLGNLVGTSRTQRLRHAERLRERQQQMARKRDLDLIAPRLEILQNMPFFIPFATRVQIFRQFVRNEQRERRGFEDPDDWRFAMLQAHNHDMSKHKATVRRESIFDDAYEQFYTLNEGLKEPIQIKFVDKFGTHEEGIDGGGVTKEFLTSITSEAFNSNSDNLDLFIENDQHLLFPNPSAVDERKDLLKEAGLRASDLDYTESLRDLLRRYEFLGRIIGKCMYEGILVDVPFAGFFLLKWALTGGTGVASRESGYRANLNDLRDLDEGLYQGLLKLKNYPGNVEDFALNFTIEDAIEQRRRNTNDYTSVQSRNRTVTRDLRHNGASISVTNENRLLYIALVARHRLQDQPRHQTSAFLHGLGQIISPSWLSMFNQSELQTLISGSRTEIDINDLRRNTLYGGVYVIGDDGMEHPTVEYFWKAMESMSDTDRRKVLKFVTSTPRAPLLGFNQLNPRFSIRDSGSDQTRLPTTSTCVNLLKLPIYKDLKTLKERLLYSVNAGAGFNLS